MKVSCWLSDVHPSVHPDTKPTAPAEAESKSENDDITFLKSLAEKSKESNNETPVSDSVDDESDSTKNRRLADDYDSTKKGMDYKYQGEKFRKPADKIDNISQCNVQFTAGGLHFDLQIHQNQ